MNKYEQWWPPPFELTWYIPGAEATWWTEIFLFAGKPKGWNAKEASAFTRADTVMRDISMVILKFSSTVSHFIYTPARLHYQIQLPENAWCGFRLGSVKMKTWDHGAFTFIPLVPVPLGSVAVISSCYIWRDPFQWKYSAQRLCLVVEHVQIKLSKFGQTPTVSNAFECLIPSLPPIIPSPTHLVNLTRNVLSVSCESRPASLLVCRPDVDLSDQIWLASKFVPASQLNKSAEWYVFKMGLSICKQL